MSVSRTRVSGNMTATAKLLATLAFAPAVALAFTFSSAVSAETCHGRGDALGTARVLQVSAAGTPRVGRKHFPTTLPLGPKEVVLTFDDGPWPGTTPAVLKALADECVKATFFMLGRNAVSHPALARRVLAAGHTVGHHTYSHRLIGGLSVATAEAEINRGIRAVDETLYNRPKADPVTPFFRFPGFSSNRPVLDRLQQRGIVVFGADLWASDWNPMSPAQQLRLILERLDAAGRGIILFHDTKRQTAAMLPAFLRALKRRGYRIVHVVAISGGRHTAKAS
jgi:peptidoglycan/xylan/chitin deacetylase (PgdA/CDA1 family)